MSDRPSSSRWGILGPSFVLIAGIGVAAGMFASSVRRSPHPTGTSVAGRMSTDAAAAAAAHAAAGIAPHARGAAEVLAQRREELEAQLAEEPERRELLIRMARLLQDGHRARESIPFYRRALELDDTDAQTYYDLAAVHGELGEWDRAADVLLSRLDQDGGDAIALYDLAAVRGNQSRYEDARALFEQARSATTDGELLARIAQALARLKGA